MNASVPGEAALQDQDWHPAMPQDRDKARRRQPESCICPQKVQDTRRRLKEAGLTYADVAAHTGLPVGSVTVVLCGSSKGRGPIAHAVAKTLGVLKDTMPEFVRSPKSDAKPIGDRRTRPAARLIEQASQVLTAEQFEALPPGEKVRHRIIRSGKTVRQWCQENAVSEDLVSIMIRGVVAGQFGQARAVLDLLGIKPPKVRSVTPLLLDPLKEILGTPAPMAVNHQRERVVEPVHSVAPVAKKPSPAFPTEPTSVAIAHEALYGRPVRGAVKASPDFQKPEWEVHYETLLEVWLSERRGMSSTTRSALTAAAEEICRTFKLEVDHKKNLRPWFYRQLQLGLLKPTSNGQQFKSKFIRPSAARVDAAMAFLTDFALGEGASREREVSSKSQHYLKFGRQM